jgi:hypothetical protein
MTNVRFLEITDYTSTVKVFALIDNEDGSTTSMPKAEYEVKLAEQSTMLGKVE